MAFVSRLVCSTCGTEYDPSSNPLMCRRRDFGRLDIVYDYHRVRRFLSRKKLSGRENGIWRFAELLPAKKSFAVKLGEGGTRLLKAQRLAEKMKLTNLYLKDETRNPTGSFKDRAMAVGIAKAREIGVDTVVTASSGNAAASLAAYSAKAKLKCYAFVLASASAGKLAQLMLYGASVIKVRGVERGEDPTVKMMLKAVESEDWYPCPSFGPFNPYQVEGPKTISYEIAEQLEWKSPDWILVPTGSSCLLTGVWRGIKDLTELDWIQTSPRLVPVQPHGNSPLVKAIKSNLPFSMIKAEKHPKTIATGLSDPFPWDGDAGLEAVKQTRGTGVSVSDSEILAAVKDLAKNEGIFAEPSGAAALAGLKKLLDDGLIRKGESVVVLITGSGLKDAQTH